jgi:mevalonate kinase
MSSIDSLVDRFVEFYEDTKTIEELIRINQGLLESLQISNWKLNEIKNICEKNGYACKITGAGGGGCCFALVTNREQLEELFKTLKENSISYFQTSLSSHGIRLDKIEFL